MKHISKKYTKRPYINIWFLGQQTAHAHTSLAQPYGTQRHLYTPHTLTLPDPHKRGVWYETKTPLVRTLVRFEYGGVGKM